jgi:hypothetical protein
VNGRTCPERFGSAAIALGTGFVASDWEDCARAATAAAAAAEPSTKFRRETFDVLVMDLRETAE